MTGRAMVSASATSLQVRTFRSCLLNVSSNSKLPKLDLILSTKHRFSSRSI